MKKLLSYMNSLYYFIKYCYYYIYAKIKNYTCDYWLISERGTDAGDNGFSLFTYIINNELNIKVKYLINKNSKDYNKVKNVGDIVIWGSKEHFLANLLSPCLISTHLYGYTVNGMAFKLFIMLFGKKGKMVFLQHGITKDYISFLTYPKTKLDLFITAANKENNFIKMKFGYKENQVVNTGFARFDNLHCNNEKMILIMPTWRYDIDCNKKFIQSDFYKEFNNLLNNKELSELLTNNNYKLVFYLHHEFKKYAKLFSHINNNIIIYDDSENNVQNYLKKAVLLITDYSSVSFDFAYMNKPLIYYQFDKDEERRKYYKESYFDYNRDGFGPVYNKTKNVVNYIKFMFNNKFGMEKKYKNRIDNFFEYIDDNNCKRIVDAIKGMMNI